MTATIHKTGILVLAIGLAIGYLWAAPATAKPKGNGSDVPTFMVEVLVDGAPKGSGVGIIAPGNELEVPEPNLDVDWTVCVFGDVTQVSPLRVSGNGRSLKGEYILSASGMRHRLTFDGADGPVDWTDFPTLTFEHWRVAPFGGGGPGKKDPNACSKEGFHTITIEVTPEA